MGKKHFWRFSCDSCFMENRSRISRRSHDGSRRRIRCPKEREKQLLKEGRRLTAAAEAAIACIVCSRLRSDCNFGRKGIQTRNRNNSASFPSHIWCSERHSRSPFSLDCWMMERATRDPLDIPFASLFEVTSHVRPSHEGTRQASWMPSAQRESSRMQQKVAGDRSATGLLEQVCLLREARC